MKTKKLATTERYTSIAVRSKISVEVEQKKRLGAWGKRVLVLDGSTLYAYKAKGDGGSVGGWEIGGADVHVRRNNDSNKEDSRHILVIARPPLYKLVFSFATVYEQARMIQALATSGATVTGLDAIMLFKNLKQQQEQEQKEQRQRELDANRAQEELSNSVGTDKEKMGKVENNNDNPKTSEIEEINESIYKTGSGTVDNPLYFSSTHFSRKTKDDDQADGAASSSLCTSISTRKDSDTEVTEVPPSGEDGEDKVNPLPKPPRADVTEGSPTISSSVPDNDNKESHVNSTKELPVVQSVLNSEQAQTNLLPSKKSQETNPSSASESITGSAPNELNEEENELVEDSQNNIKSENEYKEIVSKMKLERGLSIDSQIGGQLLDVGSPEGVRKILGDSPLSENVSVKTPSPVNEVGSDRESDSGKGSYGSAGDNVEPESDRSVLSDDILSDNDEKFEQLYQELSSNELPKDKQNEDQCKADETRNDEIKNEIVSEEKVLPNNLSEENKNNENNVEIEDKPPDTPPLQRVSSIIKKKDSPNTGTAKKVQFKLDATTIEPGISLKSPPPTKTELGDNSSKTANFKFSKKESVEPTSQEKPSNLKSEGTVTPSNKSPSPTKKKGIFSNIFSNTTSKKTVDTTPITAKAVTDAKTNSVPSKLDTTAKKTPANPTANLKRQPTVDLSAPLIIGGSVEMGGSISGKVSPRRIEVRDGHVLAFMPKATTPTSRLSVLGLSVTPMMGGVHPNALSLTRANRCMMVIKLNSRDEMMRWINALSDEVIKLTPEKQRASLVLYPSQKKETSEKEAKDSPEVRNNSASDSKDSNVLKEKPINNGTQEVLKVKQNDPKLPNGLDKIIPGKARISGVSKEDKMSLVSGKFSPVSDAKESIPNDAEIAGEDSSDGWFRKNKEPVIEEFEMNKLKKPTESNKLPAKKVQDTLKNKPTPLDNNRLDEEPTKENLENDKTVRKINKLNLEERWKEHKIDSSVHRNSMDTKHQPLRRLVVQSKINSQIKNSDGQDTVGSLPYSNGSPKHDYHANCHAPLERLSNHSRMLSASESNLRKSWDQKSSSNVNRLHRFGSEITLIEKSKKEFNNNIVSDTKDSSRVLVSSRIIKNQMNSNKQHNEKKRLSGTTPKSSPTHSHYRRLSAEPKEIEIIESERSSCQDLTKILGSISDIDDDQWYDDGEADEANDDNNEQSKENHNSPGITWSVAATREKFELLCSVSGENKGGKLITKTPISRKKSGRTLIKKRRSLEGGSGRRTTPKRQVKRQNTVIASSTTIENSTSIQPSENYTNYVPSSDKSFDTDTSSRIDQDIFRLQPVRDRMKTFERDVTDSNEVSLFKSYSTDCINDAAAKDNWITNQVSSSQPSSPTKSPLRRTQNVLHTPPSPSSSPEPGFISSKLINVKPKHNNSNQDNGYVSRYLTTEKQTDGRTDADVVICWKGPYIAQEAEQAVLSNISNAFLAKRRLLAREVAVARIQEKLSALEETIWDLQASMAEIDKQSSRTNVKSTNNWKTLERSLRTAEEDMSYWTTRLTQTQKEAEEARGKLAAALVSGLTQYSGDAEEVPREERQKLVNRYTQGTTMDSDEDMEEEDEEHDSFA